jgi:hypothetical protein
MREYCSLQYKMANRKLSELGLNPAVGYILATTGFILLSELIFHKTGFARYLILLIALSMFVRAAETGRTEFLMTVFGDRKSREIRVVENLVISVPFLASLICHQAFLESAGLVVGSILLAFVSFKTTFNYTLPTPFHQKPFEFLVGFRKTAYLFPLAYVLTFIAISVQNFNLGIISMLLIFGIALTYYIKPEHEYFVWSYSVSPPKFLLEKLITASKYSILTALPIAGTMFIFFPAEIDFVLLFMFLGLIYLYTAILAKYSVYPSEINLLEIILMIVSIIFPPLLLFLIPYFYIKSVNTLNAILK